MRRLAFVGVLLVAAAYPEFSAPVVDEADVVPRGVEERVNASLLDYQQRTQHQIAVAVIDSTGTESIENYAEDLFDEWGIGAEREDDGALLLIAVDDRELRIEVGYGLEGDLTDAESDRIIRDHLVPRLRRGDYGGAVEVGTQEIRRALGDTKVGAPPTTAPPEDEPSSGTSWVPFLVGGLVLLSFLGGAGSRRRSRRWGLGTPIIWGGGFGGGGLGGFGGGGFGGGGGGGFGGGGGGGSGGGGASGGW